MADAAGVAYWSYRPGQKVVVFYDDDTVWHERRVLLRGGGPGLYWIVTPDGDIYEEDLRGRSSDGPAKVRVVPPGLRTLPNLRTAVYRFREEWTPELMKKRIKEAMSRHLEAYGENGGSNESETEQPDGSSRAFDDYLAHRGGRRLIGKGPRERDSATKWSAPSPGPGSWRVADPRGAWTVGTAVEPNRDKDISLGGADGVVWKDPFWIRVEWVQEESVAAWLTARQRELQHSSSSPSEPLPLRDVAFNTAPLFDETLGGTEDGAKGAKDQRDAEDVRTLWVLYDEQNERYRSWRQLVQDSSVHTFKDWPHQGPQTTLHTLKHFLRHGGEPKAWMELWLRKHSVSSTDRVAHELRTLVDIVWLGGTYDQLNVASLASFESAVRRIQTIVEAFANSAGGAPQWDHARLYTGHVTADDLVCPDLRTWAAKRGKEEVELQQARAKLKEAKRLGLGQAGSEETVEENPPGSSGPGRGRGRGRSAKGLEAPART